MNSQENSEFQSAKDWTPDLSVGIESFDEEHKFLMSLIKILGEASPNDEQGWQMILEILLVIDRYLSQHFHNEESAMLAASLPDRENHIRVHKDFYYQLKLLILQCHSGVKSAFNGLPQFVSDWNINHITNFDLAYKGHVKSDHTQSKKVIWPTQTDELLNKSGLGLPEFKN